MRKALLSLAAFVVGMTMTQQVSALEMDVDSVYQISTTQDLMDFAVLVNDTVGGVDNSAANAVLTADIDLTDQTWVPIGWGDRKYKGTFDGKFHRIKNMVINSTIKEQGFFGVLESATIKNVIIDKSSSVTISGEGCAAAFAGCCNGSGTLTFENCGNEANVHGEKANNAAFVGCNYSSGALKIVIKNCYNTGSVDGGWENGVFSGWFASAGQVINCFNLGKISQMQDNMTLGRGLDDSKFVNSWDLNEESIDTTKMKRRECYTLTDFTAEWLTDGQLCYTLNGDQSEIGWYQNIGEDAMPTFNPSHKQVYAIGEVHCNGDLKGDISGFSNDPSVTKRDDHNFVDGICDYCGLVDETYLTAVDSVYQIGNAKQLVWFSAFAAQTPDAKAALTADIDMTGVKDWQPIGPDAADKYYCGTFDGQFHRIKNLKIESTELYRAVFGVVAGATIKNLIIDSSCYFTGGKYAAAFVGAAKGVGTLTIESCGNEAEVLGTDQNNSAFLACNLSSGNVKVVMKNCYNTGKVSGGFENGVFSGWFASAGTVTSCWNTGDLSEGDVNNALGRGIATGAFSSTYDLNSENLYSDANAAVLTLSEFTNDWMTSGRFCFMLNGDQSEIGWYQTLGSDNAPTFDPSHKRVYVQSDLNCDGSPKTPEGPFTNTEYIGKKDAHEFEDGVCIHCGKSQEGFMEQDEEGYYLIETPAQFLWFGAQANVDGSIKGKLMADMDMTGIAWEPIAKFNGVIDGQMHTISNLVIDKAQDKVGLISLGTDGATIKNIIMDATCSVTGYAYVAAFIGSSDGGGTITFQNVGNEADITGTGNNVAGIIGVNMGSAATFVIENCYNTGNITGGSESAALTGWAGDAYTIANCYNTGSVVGADGTKTLYRFGADNGNTNCYNIDGNQATAFDEETLYSGELAFLLNGSVSGGESWFQDLDSDEHPVPFSTHKKVYQVGSRLCDGSMGEDMAYSNDEGGIGDIPDHEFHNGSCDVCGYPEEGFMTPAEDGWYEISDGDQFRWFAGMVNFIDSKANARLTDDIDLGGLNWKPVGKSTHPFKGKFDGTQHFVDNLEYEGTEYCGLFGAVSDSCEISNLIVAPTCMINGTAFVGGLVGGSVGSGTVRITNCGNEAMVTATAQNAAGIIGVSMSGGCTFIITNCYNAGDITGDRETAAICGWCGGSSEITNCYNMGFITGVDGTNTLYRNGATAANNIYDIMEGGQGTQFYEEDLASGKLAFMLNNSVSGGENFYQNLGEDDYPIPFSEGYAKIYATGTILCDGTISDEMSYTNEEGGEFIKLDHEYDEDGLCVNCQHSYLISTAEQLENFSWAVQMGDAATAEVFLANDIDLADCEEWEPIGYCASNADVDVDASYPFQGTFDGQGHKIMNLTVDYPERQFVGFFGAVGGGATIRNLIIDKSCYFHGDAYVGGLIGGSTLAGNVLIENCGNEADVVADGSNGANAAGIFGCDMLSRATMTIKNCYNTGNVTGVKESAGISGWLGNGAKVFNSWNSGTISGADSGKNFARFSSAEFTNCYDPEYQDNVNHISLSSVSSGELCYLLNGSKEEDVVWYQAIDIEGVERDAHPVFDPSHGVVYNGGVGSYTNDITRSGIYAPVLEAEGEAEAIYTISGQRLTAPQKGVNIIRYSNGAVRKVLVKE